MGLVTSGTHTPLSHDLCGKHTPLHTMSGVLMLTRVQLVQTRPAGHLTGMMFPPWRQMASTGGGGGGGGTQTPTHATSGWKPAALVQLVQVYPLAQAIGMMLPP